MNTIDKLHPRAEVAKRYLENMAENASLFTEPAETSTNSAPSHLHRTTGAVSWTRKGNRKLRRRMLAQQEAAEARRDAGRDNPLPGGRRTAIDAPKAVSVAPLGDIPPVT